MPSPQHDRTTTRRDPIINVIGAGLAGSLLALLLAQQGRQVRVFERRPDPRLAAVERGRSINLALAARGIRALETAGVMPTIRPLLIEMRGRMIHEGDGQQSLVRYGQRPQEVIHSVSRAALNLALLEAADAFENVELRFDQACRGVDPATDTLQLRDTVSGEDYGLPLTPTIAADGAGSAVRQALAAAGRLQVREEPLAHDYKELTIPPGPDGRFALEPHALHIWPRGGYMLIALPNPDASFTCTLFLARDGATSFAALRSPADVDAFFRREFPDAVPLLGDPAAQYAAHPQSQLGTVYCDHWQAGGQVVLLGDAAHAIVPFHGQGMNCAFEDCIELARLIEIEADREQAFAEFQRRRQPNADAIARMALENYVEMRDTVREPRFLRQKQLALQLERRHPQRFIPRYSMVSFHPEIPYAEALRRGEVQQRILDALDGGGEATAPGPIDLAQADALVTRQLEALAPI
ncbi:MAG: NAD(P)/FAD-dependent oxidoreductase [Steroidobacteraceae bacterium]|nr:FAD-dependent monooxygenase [Nevskiaceae bacterium]MCP5339413.1 FAD-dependent monooxygenase [Nevskiaceae bacterium]MCP5360523.1 FAD-dependent monooxygenase [Nevskiaceae bacterium]MCP5472869.1 FAD-dependent monooxygenase [Nevskiaceae bacterium]